MRRILLVKTSSLGDVVHNLPVATDLRAHFPHARDRLGGGGEPRRAAGSAPRDLAGHSRSSRDAGAARCCRRPPGRKSPRLRTLLRGRAYDAVIDTQGLIKSAVIARLAPGRRYGLDWTSAREPLRPFYRSYFPRELEAACGRTQSSARGAGAELRLRRAGTVWYRAPPLEHGVAPEWMQPIAAKPYAVLLHGTSARAKLWPEHQWVKLGDHLQHVGLMPVLLWGSDDERLRSERIVKMLKHAIVAPRLPLSRDRGAARAARKRCSAWTPGSRIWRSRWAGRPSASTARPIRPPPDCMGRIERSTSATPGMRPRSPR